MKMRPGRLALYVFAVLVIVFAALPAVVVFPFAFNAQDYIGFPTDGCRCVGSIRTSGTGRGLMRRCRVSS